MRPFILIGLFLSFLSCVSVPKEAPQLSHELGVQLQELEISHMALVQNFFDGKRREVRTFIDEEWAPLFAENFFNQPAIAQAWDEIVTSEDKEARLEFIALVAPEMVFQIEKAYQKIIEPMEELESHLIRAIRDKYDYSFEMNRTLTNYLSAASKTSEIRWNYLQKAGMNPQTMNEVFNQIDLWTDNALQKGRDLKDLEVGFNQFRTQIDTLLSNFKL